MVYCPPCPLTATVQSSVCSGKSLLGGTDASLVGLEKQITNSRRPPSLSSSCDEGRVKGCGLPLTVVQVAHCTIPAPPPHLRLPHGHLGCVQLLQMPSRWQKSVLREG